MLPVRGETLIRHTAALCCRIAGSSGLLCRDSGFQNQDSKRCYRAVPTHGIGRYRHLLPPEVDKKKSKLQKVIKQGTDSEYGTLNFQVSGYNMVYVESFARYIHKYFNQMSITVEESYALPSKTTEVMLQQDVGTKMSVDCAITTHERVVQVSGLKATMASIILEVLMMNQPEGVQLLVKEHTEEDYLKRFKARPQVEKMKAAMT
ncbi:PREDICTED: 39S ribosomal protein L48, mitochondrial [Nanorana parkeri]|uniref:39S ribosomal protein L48, mitochondrial n=1 Tax=Nanorana parkeri TaxID=125878 RepID=UPI0008542CB7|nr:PREDICTED: 39S ribosomal protein L48, mitochondrial [Nanorana parkeri]XP_018428057.1 PREDICTED: 39S ribosomal protein L48, mitochondrial [Nanorana parkeri]